MPAPRHGSYDGPTAEFPGLYPPERPRPERRGSRWLNSSVLAVVAAFLAVVLLGAAGYILLRPSKQPETIGPGPAVTSTDPASPSATASATPSATPSRTPTRTSAKSSKPKIPRPTQRPPANQLPPPPPPTTTAAGCTPKEDTAHNASAADVRAALADAGARANWRSGVTVPTGWPAGTPYPPDISVPAKLMNAVAFTESSWRSTVIACDGGIGLMQIMPGTAPWMNQRFNRSDDVNTMQGNANIGAMYLQWLTMYFGLYYFGSFDLSDTEAIGPGGTDLMLQDVVIAAYNVGYGGVEHLNGTSDPSDDYLSIPNPSYVSKVHQYLASCPCDSM
jgi:soluble lytic murein transglycosylase-like protein